LLASALTCGAWAHLLVAIIPLSRGPGKRFGISYLSAGTRFSGAGMDLLNREGLLYVWK
jgi:hypothetical protein